MSQKTRTYLTNRFVTGYKPVQQDYTDIMDSFYNILSDSVVGATGPTGPTGATGSAGAIGVTGSDASTILTANRQTTNYTLVLADANKLVEMNIGSTNSLTVPPNSSVAFLTGSQILLAQYGAGQTTIVAATGVSVRSSGGKLKLSAQYSGASLVKIATDEWYLFGDITT